MGQLSSHRRASSRLVNGRGRASPQPIACGINESASFYDESIRYRIIIVEIKQRYSKVNIQLMRWRIVVQRIECESTLIIELTPH